ncbi:uncharacterized protein [Rutidosis leptorrhynchoides]|uniref:uncharacterized protein n=1 Tax=Rutidosis leptorrhynchoides TaxID=125765 RepID=UPI003A98F58D
MLESSSKTPLIDVTNSCSSFTGDGSLGHDIEELGIEFTNSFKKIVGNGKDTLFWNDVWLDDVPLCTKFNRLFRADSNPKASIFDRVGWDGTNCVWSWNWVRLLHGQTKAEFEDLLRLLQEFKYETNNEDGWQWSLASNGKFTTKVLTSLIQAKIGVGNETLRNSLVPKEVGIFVWRALKSRLPFLYELDKREIDLRSVRCPLCDDAIETAQHSIYQCSKCVEI